MSRVDITDHSLTWNIDIIETLESQCTLIYLANNPKTSNSHYTLKMHYSNRFYLT